MHSWFCKVQGTISDVPLPKNHMQILCVGTEDHDQETYHLTKHLISPMKHHLQVLTKFTDTFFLTILWQISIPGHFSCPNKTAPEECLAGLYAAAGSIKCQPCPKGASCPTKGLSTYVLCSNGTYSDADSLSDCKVCPAGFQCPSVGMEAPEECANGTYSNTTGARYCILCPEGHRWAVGPFMSTSFHVIDPHQDIINLWFVVIVVLIIVIIFLIIIISISIIIIIIIIIISIVIVNVSALDTCIIMDQKRVSFCLCLLLLEQLLLEQLIDIV